MPVAFLLNIGLLIWLMAAGWGLGALVLRALRLEDLAWGTQLARLSIGLGVLAHLTLALGVLFPLSAALTWGLLAIGGVAALVTILHERRSIFKRPVQARLGRFEVLLVVTIAANCLYALLRNGLMPPISYDEVAYHLGIPQIYIQQGTIGYIPFIPNSNWPLEMEMLFLLALLVKAETLTHLLTWAALPLTCLGLVSFGERLFSRQAGLAAAAIFSGTIMVTSLAGTGLIEMPLALFSFQAMAFFLLWVQYHQARYWLLSALLAGLAASVKLNAAVTAAILGGLVALVSLYRKEGWRVAVFRLAGFGLLALAVVAPWYFKSWLQTGNPVWPFLMQLFPTRDWNSLVNSYFFGFTLRPNLELSLPNFFYALWLVSADSARFGYIWFRLGWLYLAAILPVAVAGWKMAPLKRSWMGWLAALSLLCYLSWFLQTHQVRFLMPFVPLFALLVGAGADEWMQSRFRLVRWAMGLALLGVLAANSWIADPTEIALLRSNKAYLLGIESRDQYLSLHSTSYDAFIYANATLPPDAYVLLALMESRGYYLERPYFWLNPVAQGNLRLEEILSVEQFAAELAHRGFTFILYNMANDSLYQDLEPGSNKVQLFHELLQKYGRLQFSSGVMELYQFIPAGVQ